MTIAANLGFPRIGARRELKRAVEDYWAGRIDEDALHETARGLRRNAWLLQRDAGIEHIPSNDFSFYDHVLDTAAMLGAVPSRFGHDDGPVSLDTYFAMARGADKAPAMEMTKWFDTNYHYIVPEFEEGQTFRLSSTQHLDHCLEAKALGIETRPVLLGPITFLLLGKMQEPGRDRLSLLSGIVPVYAEALRQLSEAGAEWVQMDEPALGLTMDNRARAALGQAYAALAASAPRLKMLVAVYFSGLRENLRTALALPTAGVHLDLARDPGQLDEALHKLGPDKVLSLGVVDGRNVWRTDLEQAMAPLERAASVLGAGRLMVAPSCSLLHAPVDLELETEIDPEMRSWLAFAAQKVREVSHLTQAINGGRGQAAAAFADNAKAMAARRSSPRIHDPAVKERAASVTPQMLARNSAFGVRREAQRGAVELPLYPTTTVGSFPQTSEIRRIRAAYRRGGASERRYREFLRSEIRRVIRFQEELGLDVLVHGEPERNDMVEYFGEQMNGFLHTSNGWVQSYGSRCVKPPVIFGDVSRPHPITVRWAKYAQSLSEKPVKGMLTGPVTMLQWSFVRDDQPRSETCRQLALAIRDEVIDLERAKIRIIQIDEPAIREGLPLRQEDWDEYLTWAVESFRLASSGVADHTQIHTHMCYAAYGEIIDSIAALDADVISMEAARSSMELLGAFKESPYPNHIGPGVYDIHSPRVPPTDEIGGLLSRAAEVLSDDQLWVNPDCGLKTRGWAEVEASLKHMIAAAKRARRAARPRSRKSAAKAAPRRRSATA
ncbi:MAG: 5-methyltetrahydropteroyltriglutamate--homocysteine S-methyltransferase [Dehalococcoidia bacterium]|nr:5-methyltetrahydropteroyltriglutamate--homocysteine S-methyltransferase [Dehalococcoidia bacterium]